MKNHSSIKHLLSTGIGFIIIVTLMSSCKKENMETIVPPTDIKTLTVSPDFDWKTSREITLNVVGMSEVNPEITNTLYVNSPAGVNYYKDLLTMYMDYTIRFAVPSTETSVNLVYGSKTKTIQLTSDNITFDYITE